MARCTSITLAILLLVYAAADNSNCDLREHRVNNVTFEYKVCKDDTPVTQFASSTLCNVALPGSHLVTFKTKDEFDFVLEFLSSTTLISSNDFRFIPGFYHHKRGSPENLISQKFYWLDDINTRVTENSSTYWQPFNSHITQFASLNESEQQLVYFVMNTQGEVFPGGTFLVEQTQTAISGYVCKKEKGALYETVAIYIPSPPGTTTDSDQQQIGVSAATENIVSIYILAVLFLLIMG